jgi:glycine hydroxymethyltransferase
MPGPPRLLTSYLGRVDRAKLDPAACAFYASLDVLSEHSPIVATAIIREFRDQRRNLKLIASENYSSLATQLAQGNLLTDKYAEGYVAHRFYAGCDNVDTIEAEAVRLACDLFGADHAYVQPHSGADANLVAFLAILNAKVQSPALAKLGEKDPTRLSLADWNRVRTEVHGQRLLALDYYSGGHLTHGYRHNVSSHLFECHYYGVEADTGLISLDKLRATLREIRPLILLAGYSAYPRKLNFAAMREMADEVGAVFMVDMAHFAGLVAGKAFTGDYDPVAHAHVVTSTTHKTLRGPRGGFVLCKKEMAEWVDKGCPMALGGPLVHAIAAKAVAFREASQPEFRSYAAGIVANTKALGEACIRLGMPVLTGGSDNHLLLIDVAKGFGLNGRQAESALRQCGVTLNRNAIPFDPNGPWYTSGLRVGTPAVTTLGMKDAEMREIADVMKLVLSNVSPGEPAGKESARHSAKYTLDEAVVDQAAGRVRQLLGRFPLYPELDLDMLLEPEPAAGIAGSV